MPLLERGPAGWVGGGSSLEDPRQENSGLPLRPDATQQDPTPEYNSARKRLSPFVTSAGEADATRRIGALSSCQSEVEVALLLFRRGCLVLQLYSGP